MGFLDNLFGRKEKHQTMLDKVQDVGGKLIVDGYRKLSRKTGLAPTAQTSDGEIIAMYKKVGTAFQVASETRGEHLSAGVKNSIVFKFLQVKEMLGAEMVDSHLAYEVENYVKSGLRSDYKEEIKLF
jgi:hypothetical protein